MAIETPATATVTPTATPTKTMSPDVTMEHEERVNTLSPSHSEPFVAFQAYEARKIDLRTALGLLALAITYESCLFSIVLPSQILLAINQDIGPSNNIAWVPTAWALSSAVTMTIAGRCSDIFGRRNFFLVGNLLGIIGCTIACRATNVSVLIMGSSFVGVSGGLQQLAYAAANEIVPKKNRGQTMALMTLVSLPGSAFGAPIAYRILAVATWRWTYYVALIVNTLAFVSILVLYWPPNFVGLHPEGKTRRQQFLELDFLGLLLLGGGLTVFLIGVGFGGNPYPWTSGIVLSTTIIGGVSVFVAFPLWEVYCPDTVTKLCPPTLTRNIRAVVVPIAVSFVSGMALMSTAILWPQQIQRLFTTVPKTVGWYALAANGCATIGFVMIGQTFASVRRTRWQYIFVVVMMAIFLGLNATVNQNTPVRAIVFIGLASVMIGATNCISLLIVQLGARDEDIGLATGLVNSVRATGSAVGVAVYSSLLANRVASTYGPIISTALLAAGLPASSLTEFLTGLPTGNIMNVPGVTPSIIEAGLQAQKTVFVGAFRLVYCVTVAFGGLAIIGAVFVASVDDNLTQQVNVQLDRPHLIGHGNGEAMVLHEKEQPIKE